MKTISLLLILAVTAHAADLRVTDSTCDWRVRPLGIDVPQPDLGWTLESSRRGETQTAYQILAASDVALLSAGKPDLWDSGKVSSDESIGIRYAGKPLASGQRVWWQVRAWDGEGKPGPYSEAQWWEMGLLSKNDWQAKWISDGRPLPERDEDFYKPHPAPLLRKSFKLRGPVKQARIYTTAAGYQELSLNGKPLGDHRLDPAWTAVEKRVYYSTHDVTAQLKPGENALGIVLGNGWYNPLPMRFWGGKNFRLSLTSGRPCAILRLDIQYADGTRQTIVTDESWRWKEGPIIRNNIFLGELYDARKEIAGWDAPGFNDPSWNAVVVETPPVGKLQALSGPPIRITEELAAKRIESSTGPPIYDFGKNFTGTVRLRFNAPAGTRYLMRYGELLHADGTLNPMTSVAGQIKKRNKDGTMSMGGPGAPDIAWQEDTYITKGGGEEEYTPRFTFHAFRYMEISAAPVSVTGLRLHSDVPDAGSFECSNDLFNRIQRVCRNTFVSNIIGVQSDCPHRERLGYGGDIVASSEAFFMNYDMHGFYRKTVRDFADTARPDGRFTDTAPFVGIDYCGVGWAMAHPLLIEQLYRYQGDRSLMEEQYEAARRWLLGVETANPEHIVSNGLGDHEGLVPKSIPASVTSFYYQSAVMLANMAKVLKRTDDAARFSALSENIKRAYQKQFLDEKTGVVALGSQMCQSSALYSGLVPDAVRPLAMERLLEDIRDKHKGHLSTGIYGTKYMLEMLSSHGRADTTFQIVSKPEMPGWAWMLKNDATTLWEHWAGSDNTFSNNHPMFGSVSQWFFQWPGGIRPAHDAVGFNKILIAPQVVGDLKWAKTEHRSVRGPISCQWKKDGGNFDLSLRIPVGATAEVTIPARNAEAVKEGGEATSAAAGVKFLRMDRNAAVFAVGSGSYQFRSTVE
jgi:alpha-L-rhamnosidase